MSWSNQSFNQYPITVTIMTSRMSQLKESAEKIEWVPRCAKVHASRKTRNAHIKPAMRMRLGKRMKDAMAFITKLA